MLKKSPYDIVFSKHVTEKARVLGQLQFNSSNPCVKKCNAPKYVFIVDKRANKQEIAEAIEEIYQRKENQSCLSKHDQYKGESRGECVGVKE